MKYIKIDPIQISFNYPRRSTKMIVTTMESIYINPIHIALIQERKEEDYTGKRSFTSIGITGVNEPIIIDMDIKKFIVLAEGARQEAMEVLYG